VNSISECLIFLRPNSRQTQPGRGSTTLYTAGMAETAALQRTAVVPRGGTLERIVRFSLHRRLGFQRPNSALPQELLMRIQKPIPCG